MTHHIFDLCLKVYRYRTAFENHRSVHFEQVLKYFTSKSTLIRHKCHLCSEDFDNKEAVTNHVIFHYDMDQLKCNICEKYFATKGTLRRHIMIHSGEKSYECPVCKKRLIQFSNMKCHERLRHTMKLDNRRFEYDHC